MGDPHRRGGVDSAVGGVDGEGGGTGGVGGGAGAVGLTYAAAGVDIDAGERAVELIRGLVRSTRRPEVIGGIGGFGGMFAFPAGRYRDPVLVAATDGVGTKAVVARDARRLTTVGIDLVAMCVDDLVCQGAEPLFFLDYIAVGRVEPDEVRQLLEGVAEGCRQAGCAILGGETAEHPGSMATGDFDLAGFAVGVVERDRLLDGSRVRAGDVLVALPSPGLRSNGYSLARRIFFERAGRSLDDAAWPGASHSLADELLVPSVIYTKAMLALMSAVDVHAVAHITGGGIPGNLVRVLPDQCDAVVDRTSWEPPRIFGELQRLGGVDDAEMAKVFNLGAGMIAVVGPDDEQGALQALAAAGQPAAWTIGSVTAGSRVVRLVGQR